MARGGARPAGYPNPGFRLQPAQQGAASLPGARGSRHATRRAESRHARLPERTHAMPGREATRAAGMVGRSATKCRRRMSFRVPIRVPALTPRIPRVHSEIPMRRTAPASVVAYGLARLLSALPVAAILTSAATAAPGDLDPGFGLDGRALVPFGPGVAQAHSIARLPDGRIVLAGSSGAEPYEDFCAITVLTPEGVPDPSFGIDGRLEIDRDPGRVNTCTSVAVQPDGRIVLAGSRDTGTPAGTRDFVVMRLHADGSFDESFSDNGFEFVNFALPGPVVRSIDEAHALAVQPDGRIVIAGSAERAPGDFDFALVRFMPDGTIDHGFGDDGRVVFGIDDGGPTVDVVSAVASLPDGRIALAGISEGADRRMVVARLTADGQLDPGFNLTGRRLVTFGFAPESIGTSLVLRGDGSLLVGGYISDGQTADFAVAALAPDGSYDLGFGNDGRATIDFGEEEGAFAMAMDASARVVLGGVRIETGHIDIAAVRLHADGTPDASFGDFGRVVIAFDLSEPDETDLARALLVQPDGDVVLAGAAMTSNVPPGAAFAAVRLQGDRDTLFADGFDPN